MGKPHMEGRSQPAPQAFALPAGIEAVIFDLDGVITDTASVHMAAWKRLFDDFLRERAERTGEPFEEFSAADYRAYVDGKPRYDGAASFLQSRGIALPYGQPSDEPEAGTLCGLANRKNELFGKVLREQGVERFESSVAVLERLRAQGVATAVVSSSRNCREVVERAGLTDLFDARVDGAMADELGLPGKPDPAMFLEAARRLGVRPDRAVVVEDAVSGVEAGHRGGFALVVGMDRTGHPEALRRHGADVIVTDLAELADLEPADPHPVDEGDGDPRTIRDLPLVTGRGDLLAERLGPRTPAVFLDYDGTLTPIVEDPRAATLPESTRAAIERLAAVVPVAIVSGRDLDDVRGLVGIDDIAYAGSHGFDILQANGERHERAPEALPLLDEAEQWLTRELGDIDGLAVERKRFAVAVHYRRVAAERVAEIERVVERVAASRDGLRKTGGKKIFELRPDVEWNKGKALLWLLGVLGLDRPDVVPVYVGDDLTDEDAFEAIRRGGIGIVVSGEDDDRPTAAHYAVAHPDDVRDVLDAISATAGAR